MTSTSHKQAARELLALCLDGQAPASLPAELLADDAAPALFGIFVEGLADRFEPALCDVYARLFAQAVAHAAPGTDTDALVDRYRRVRIAAPIERDPRRVFVLSRITLGADVAVTSVVLDAALRRFPEAEIHFVAPRKNFELFAAHPRLRHTPIDYRRGSLRDRLAAWEALRRLADSPGTLVLDPDSRLTQLGLLPVCDDRDYRFFESRAAGGDRDLALPELAAEWCRTVLAIDDARPFLALAPAPTGYSIGGIAISLGVGENPAKRLPDPFEANLLATLAGTGLPLIIDKGAGGEETARVEAALAQSGVTAAAWEGSFAGFAALVAASRLYIGYDSAGQHAAAASGIPLVTIFAGFPSPRMFARWRPAAPQATVIRVDKPDPAAVLAQVNAALSRLLAP